MIIWIVILVIIALSLLSGEFGEVTSDFIERHVLAIFLVAIAMLYIMKKEKEK